jgi:hypothetical protein
MYSNQLTIIGCSGQDAHFHFTSKYICHEAIRCDQRILEPTDLAKPDLRHRIPAFGKSAECAKSLSKGTHVMVQGV